MKDKIIFLDIDGVLNVIGQGHDEYGQIFHKHLEDNLRYVIEQTGAKIVISSTWRMSGLKVMKEMWEKRNLPGEVIGITPTEVDVVNRGTVEFYDMVDRGYEIQQYINDNNVKNYIIFDDDNDMLPSQFPYFIRTSNNQDHEDCVDIGYGLTRKCAEKAIEILNRKRVLSRTRKALFILEAGFIYCKRRGIEYSDNIFIHGIFLSDEFNNSQSDEFEKICKDLRSYRYFKSYDLIEITEDEYENCVDEFGEIIIANDSEMKKSSYTEKKKFHKVIEINYPRTFEIWEGIEFIKKGIDFEIPENLHQDLCLKMVTHDGLNMSTCESFNEGFIICKPIK